MELGWIVGLAVAFVGGQGFGKIVDILFDMAKGASGRRRAEVDSAAKVAGAAKAEAVVANALAEDAIRDRRIALELLSATRRIALDHGVPLGDLPKVKLEE